MAALGSGYLCFRHLVSLIYFLGYLMIVGGFLSDSSSGTYATDEVDVVDILSDTASCTPPKDFNSYGPHFLS